VNVLTSIFRLQQFFRFAQIVYHTLLVLLRFVKELRQKKTHTALYVKPITTDERKSKLNSKINDKQKKAKTGNQHVKSLTLIYLINIVLAI